VLKISAPKLQALRYLADWVKTFFDVLPTVPIPHASTQLNFAFGRALQNQAHSGPIGF